MTLVDAAIEGVDGNAPNKMSTQLLTRTLIHAFYWMDDGLQHYMQYQVGFSLPRAQSMMMIPILKMAGRKFSGLLTKVRKCERLQGSV